MKKARRIACALLALVMVLALSVPAFAEEPAAADGTITISNATKGESYHIYRLFGVTVGAVEENGKIPTDYIATKEQADALSAMDDNVFAFAEQADGTYQVTVKKDPGTNATYTNDKVIAFIGSFIRELSGGVVACGFPGAVEVSGAGNEGIGTDNVATASTVVWKGLPYGYYFVTSSLGAVVSVSTSNPDAEITDKNPDDPDWNNEPDEPKPDGPVKDVLNDTGTTSIKDQQVKVDDILTYEISYTNESGAELDKVVITDAAPEGTKYQPDTAKAYLRKADGTLEEQIGSAGVVDATSGNITWTFNKVAADATIVVRFKVEVTEEAKTITDKTIVNDATTDVTIGENQYHLVTNQVKNPVDNPNDPKKDALNAAGVSIDGNKVKVGDTLTYQISYTNSGDAELESVVITDAAPTGTVYIKESAKGTRTGTADADDTIAVGTDGTITWTFKKVAVGETVTATFDVKVTEAAKTITDKTVVNEADVSLNGNPAIKTNKVENPVGDEPHDPNPGKVIVNADGSESTKSTGAYGDTVTFDIGVNAVNQVEQTYTNGEGDTVTENVQVKFYYIYDKMDKGLILNQDSLTVTISGTAYKATANGATGNVTNYTIGGGIILFTSTTETGETLIEAKIPWTNADGSAIYPNCKLHLTYDAVINEDAVIAGDGNMNRVRFDYSTVLDTTPKEPDPTDPKYPTGDDLNHGSDEKVTVTYTYALGLQKYSAETGEPLADAIFTAKDAGGNEIHAEEVAGQPGVYNYSAGGTVSSFKTNSDGQIIIKGVDVGSYSFKETEAPKGYNLLADPVPVEAQMDSAAEVHNRTDWEVTRTFEVIPEAEFAGYSGAVYQKNAEGEFVKATTKPATWSADLYKLTGTAAAGTTPEEGYTSVTFPVNVALLQVKNNAGSLLPSTGGIGTTIFYTVGGALVLAAVVLLVTKKRMQE